MNEIYTKKNLKEAFIKESSSANRYLYFAKIAAFEGYSEVSQLFQDFAEINICNAHGNLDFLKNYGDPDNNLPIGETNHNLKHAVFSETSEHNEFYPMMASIAHKEGYPDIANWFESLAKLKKTYLDKLEEILNRND